MAICQVVYGDDTQVVHETSNDVKLEHEVGWLVVLRGKDAILRLREEYVQSREEGNGEP